MNGEFLYEYWERFNGLCASCPQHQITDQLLIQYFYEGFLPSDKRIVDAASGGALVNKTPAEAKELISNMPKIPNNLELGKTNLGELMKFHMEHLSSLSCLKLLIC